LPTSGLSQLNEFVRPENVKYGTYPQCVRNAVQMTGKSLDIANNWYDYTLIL